MKILIEFKLVIVIFLNTFSFLLEHIPFLVIFTIKLAKCSTEVSHQ